MTLSERIKHAVSKKQESVLSASFIPVFSHYLHHDKKIAFRISSTVINALIILFIVLALIIFIFAYPFSKLITPGFTESQLILMASLTRILIIAQIFFLISNFLTGMIQVYQMFL